METTILLNGFSILNNSSISVSTSGGYLDEGGLTVTGGSMIFEADDIIMLEVIDANADGSIDSGASITRIVVYDNATDYFNHVVKYTYEGNNPNQTGSIRSETAGVGDRYLRINANVLNSDDPGAPDINQLFIAAGVDLSSVAAGGTLTIDQFQDTDYNDNDTIDGGSAEPADGLFQGGADGNNSLVVLCFARGTLIETPDGPRYIETLRAGDLVNTLDAGPQPLTWVGHQRMTGTGAMAPVRIRAGALGNIRDLWVSQNHRILVRSAGTQLLFARREVLVAAKYLTDGDRIAIVPRAQVDYYHLLLESHQVIFAEGCPAESLYPGYHAYGDQGTAERDEILAHFPDISMLDQHAPMSRYPLRRFEAEVLRSA